MLLSAVTYYMDVLRDTAILDLDRNNVEVLQEQLRQTQDRFNVGEVTRTDVAQAEASLAGARATALGAQSQLAGVVGQYRQAIGDEPKSLAPVAPIGKQLPKTLAEAMAISQVEHPAIVAMLHGVDAAALAVKITEGALYPTVGVTGQLQKRFDYKATPGEQALHRLDRRRRSTCRSTMAALSYAVDASGQGATRPDGAANRSAARQGARRGRRGLGREREFVGRAARRAGRGPGGRSGARRRARGGQGRPAHDARRPQRAAGVAQRARSTRHRSARQVVNSYSLLSAIGRLSIRTLGLAVPEYDPRVHFDQVKNKLWGVRTPDGK